MTSDAAGDHCERKEGHTLRKPTTRSPSTGLGGRHYCDTTIRRDNDAIPHQARDHHGTAHDRRAPVKPAVAVVCPNALGRQYAPAAVGRRHYPADLLRPLPL